MTEQHIRIPMPDGEADAVLFQPENTSGAPLPGVIDLPDIGGMRDASMQMSRRLAGEGYVVLLPNPFYRVSAPPVFSFPMKFPEPRTMQRFAELIKPLTPDAIHADGRAYVAALDANGAAPGPVAILGHCFTGALALRIAAALPDRIAAVASFHGGGLYVAGDPISPHTELPQVKARLLLAHAKEDGSMNAEAIQHLEAALKQWGGQYQSETFDAHHGWTVPDSAAYNQPEAEKAYSKLKDLLASTLKR
ncbi:MAG: dienelactone hydrolase family protein [Acidobacteriaceae bacterium]